MGTRASSRGAPPPQRASDAARRTGHARALRRALLASTVIHAVVLTTVRFPAGSGQAESEPRGTSAAHRALRLLDLRIEEPEAGGEPTPEPPAPAPPAGARRFPSDAEPPAPGAPPRTGGARPRASEALRPALREPRLWSATPSRPADPALRERARLRARVDSVARESAGVTVPPGEDMRAWTASDASGNRWGLSPGRIHLGSLTIPTCSGRFDASTCGFGVAPENREAYRARLWVQVELRRQAEREAVRERAAAIRARRDSLRGSAPPPRR